MTEAVMKYMKMISCQKKEMFVFLLLMERKKAN